MWSRYLIPALLLILSLPLTLRAAEDGEKVALTELPAAVNTGFGKEVPGGTLVSAKKLAEKDGTKVRYQLKYKLEGKEHQLTLGEDGERTQKKKDEKDADGK